MDITKFWKDMHHPRSPRAPYYRTLLGPTAGAAAAADLHQAAVQYLQSVQHKQGVSRPCSVFKILCMNFTLCCKDEQVVMSGWGQTSVVIAADSYAPWIRPVDQIHARRMFKASQCWTDI